MMKYKTLKEIQEKTAKDMQTSFASYGAFSANLRQEAIKWIKELKEEQKMMPIEEDEQSYYSRDGAITMFKHFFNIKKEDLIEQIETPSKQIERLATFILQNIEGEPSKNEGAVDTAIRIMSKYHGSPGEDF